MMLRLRRKDRAVLCKAIVAHKVYRNVDGAEDDKRNDEDLHDQKDRIGSRHPVSHGRTVRVCLFDPIKAED